MKDINIRIISGALYIFIFLAALLSSYSILLFFLILGVISTLEFCKLTKLNPYVTTALFLALYLFFSTTYFYNFQTNKYYNSLLLSFHSLSIITIFILITNLFTNKKHLKICNTHYLCAIFYITAGFIFLVQIALFSKPFNPYIILGAFIIIWVNDSFAYLVGKAFGKHKLFSSISPKKTVEGFIGGLFFSAISGLIFAQLSQTLSLGQWFILALLISVFGTIGDLIESKFKRLAKVKDSGKIMPGHGGILDRLDSIIFVAPIIYLFLRITTYVS